jgi:hypothetical protein
MERELLNDGLNPVAYAFPAMPGDVLNTVYDRGILDNHPRYVHREHVWDFGSGFGAYDRTANEARWARASGKPVRRE